MPTFTTSNERMLLLLADGASGMLRVEDAERLQVGWRGEVCSVWLPWAATPACGFYPVDVCHELCSGQQAPAASGRPIGLACPPPAAAFLSLAPQGLPEGHTRPCWPIQTPGVGAHRARPPRTEADAEAAASKRWDLLGELGSCTAVLGRRQWVSNCALGGSHVG